MFYSDDVLWMVVVGFIIAFILAFGIGANDVANSFGTSVGAKVLTLRQACILGTIFEMAGAILIGYRVSDTIRKGIIDVTLYNNGSENILMAGNVAALSGSCLWLLIATFLKVPVSTTHSIVGATIGFALVAHGVQGINWRKLGFIVGSWFISPLMSGFVTIVTFMFINFTVLKKKDSFNVGLRLLPLFYGLTAAINAFSVFYKGSDLLHFDEIPLYGVMILTFGIAIIVFIVIHFLFVPYYRKKINEKYDTDVENNQVEEYSPQTIISTSDIPDFAEIELEVSDEGVKMPLTDHMRVKDDIDDKENLEGVGLNENTPLKNREILGEKDTNVDDNEITPSGSASASSNESTPVTSSKSRLLPSSLKFTNQQKPEQTRSAMSSRSDIDECVEQDKIHKGRSEVEDEPKTAKLFSWLQVLTAVFGSFAHGGNDVSNAIGPLVSIWIIATEGSALQKAETPIWILIYGGVGISIGLWIWGRRVIETVGQDLTKITPSSGFCIEIGSALTVLIASNIGIPISSTHCKVGSVVAVGRLRSKANVDWKLFRNIILAWVLTLPVAGGFSAALMAGFQELV